MAKSVVHVADVQVNGEIKPEYIGGNLTDDCVRFENAMKQIVGSAYNKNVIIKRAHSDAKRK